MKLKREIDPHKKKIIQMAVGAGIFILLVIFTGFIINYAQKSARDTVRLSDVAMIRLDLITYFHRYNRFPRNIYNKGSVPEKNDCQNDLCLDYAPYDPLTGAVFAYNSCRESGGADCLAGNPAGGYRLYYGLETGQSGFAPGAHYADSEDICADPACRIAR